MAIHRGGIILHFNSRLACANRKLFPKSPSLHNPPFRSVSLRLSVSDREFVGTILADTSAGGELRGPDNIPECGGVESFIVSHGAGRRAGSFVLFCQIESNSHHRRPVL